mmetsp:Transcript_14568/g.50760  ORF Transcript_14568/g.50760 Transcript_14568/m.50760 type:complete len:571 (-) Transcript_14568:145-1857(-)
MAILRRGGAPAVAVVVAVAFAAAGVAAAGGAAPPPTSNVYSVQGVIRLPYANLSETFSVWFDGKGGRQRVEYYGGIDAVVTRADQNVSYEIVPVGGVNGSKTTCFGPLPHTSGLTSFFPTPDGFEAQSGTVTKDGVVCTVYAKTVTTLGREMVYQFYWSTGDEPVPVALEFVGYDMLLGSHFDQYSISYTGYTSTPNLTDPTLFQPPADLTCGGFPGPGAEEGERADPIATIARLVHGDDAAPAAAAHEDARFAEFVDRHGRQYEDDVAARRARVNYMHNARLVASLNRARTSAASASFALNHLADLSPADMRAMRGRKYRAEAGGNGADRYHDASVGFGPAGAPASVDWRTKGAVTAVKDQAICGSCWSFATTGTMEGQLFLATGALTNLSQQELIDCSWAEGNNGCDGGEDFRAYRWIKENGGLMAATDYGDGQYKFSDWPCRVADSGGHKPVARIASYVNVTANDTTALQHAIATVGPVSVSIDASHPSFGFYTSGTYYEPACGNAPADLDHAVLAVGYGTDDDGQAYFIVKNSWSTHWGSDGYIHMSAKDNNCGVATFPTYPVLAF